MGISSIGDLTSKRYVWHDIPHGEWLSKTYRLDNELSIPYSLAITEGGGIDNSVFNPNMTKSCPKDKGK